MLTLSTFLSMTLFWHAFSFLVSRMLPHALESATAKRIIPDATARAVLITQSPTYVSSTLHALYLWPRGVSHLFRLFRASIPLKLHNPPLHSDFTPYPFEKPFLAEISRVMWSNVVLAGYLTSDLIFVLYNYPNLGGIDVVLHHIAFLYCATVAGYFQLHPFMFGWLIVGESSTVFLNMRWFLIKSGYTDNPFFKLNQLAFVLVFFFTRFCVYGAGLVYQIDMLGQMPEYIPKWAVYSTMAFVVIGFFLNMAWMYKIIQAVRRPHKKTSGQSKKPSEPTNEPVKAE